MPIPGQTTLQAVRDQVRQRADMVNNTFVTDAEVNGYINQAYYEVYDLLVQKYGDNYFVAAPYTFTTDGTNTKFALPSDFYKMLGVEVALNVGANQYVNVPRFTFMDRNRYTSPNNSVTNGYTNLRYNLNGSSIWFMPRPSSGQNIQIWYVPRLTALTTNSDVIDGVSGWEEYIITDAAIRCLQKEESDVSALMAQKAALIARIEAAAENRDAGNPQTTTDAYAANSGLIPGMSGFGGPGWGGF